MQQHAPLLLYLLPFIANGDPCYLRSPRPPCLSQDFILFCALGEEYIDIERKWCGCCAVFGPAAESLAGFASKQHRRACA